MVVIEDEHGSSWAIDKGDPAYGACRTLIRAGIAAAHITLPRALIVGGKVPQSDIAAALDTAMDAQFLRYSRIWDCLVALDMV